MTEPRKQSEQRSAAQCIRCGHALSPKQLWLHLCRSVPGVKSEGQQTWSPGFLPGQRGLCDPAHAWREAAMAARDSTCPHLASAAGGWLTGPPGSRTRGLSPQGPKPGVGRHSKHAAEARARQTSAPWTPAQMTARMKAGGGRRGNNQVPNDKFCCLPNLTDGDKHSSLILTLLRGGTKKLANINAMSSWTYSKRFEKT